MVKLLESFQNWEDNGTAAAAAPGDPLFPGPTLHCTALDYLTAFPKLNIKI